MHRVLFYFVLLASALLSNTLVHAQVCTGSLGAPVVNETFGSGASVSGPPLQSGVTTLQYNADACSAEDGQYAITNHIFSSGCKGGTWKIINHDHTFYTTGDPTGYMMVINASLTPSLFYTQRVAGNKFCPGTVYELGAYIMNILRDIRQTQGYSKPNISFRIEDANGNLLAPVYNTGDIPGNDLQDDWTKYGTFFTSPTDGSDVIVKMINNGKGGNGNDLALDDITFSPCGPIIQSGFGNVIDTARKSNCVGGTLNYQLVAQQTGYANPTYKWQQNINNTKWSDIQGQTSLMLNVNVPNASLGRYQYRIGILEGSKTGSEQCRIYSEPLLIQVFDYPKPVIDPITTVCTGSPLRLTATGGADEQSYFWTGPIGYTSAQHYPAVTLNADVSYNGVYTVRVTKNGCPAFANTTVTVYPKAIVSPISNINICTGTSTQLNAIATGTTHYKWTPATGLDQDDIPNPIATPTKTTTYTVSVSNDGCIDAAANTSVTVNVLNSPLANAGPAVKMFEGQTATLNGTATGDNIIQTYWTPTDYLNDTYSLTPITSAIKDITYTLHVVSATCGESTSDVFVRVYNKLNIFNTFTPNGDGVNDLWNITNLTTYPNAVLEVYDRQGQKVYRSQGYSTPWDGIYAGARLPAGTYYYIIDFKENNLPKVSGWVFIAR